MSIHYHIYKLIMKTSFISSDIQGSFLEQVHFIHNDVFLYKLEPITHKYNNKKNTKKEKTLWILSS